MPDWISQDDLSRTIELWGAILSTVITLATVVQVLVTYLIARSISKASSISESIEISRNIDSQWQEYNMRVICDSKFRSVHRKLEGLDNEPEGVTQVRYLIFYILNVVYIAWTSEKAKKDHFDHAKTIIKDHLRIIYSERDLVLSILDGGRGYNDIFVSDCKKAFALIEAELKLEDVIVEEDGDD